MKLFTPKHINYIRGAVSINQTKFAARQIIKEVNKKKGYFIAVSCGPNYILDVLEELESCETHGQLYNFLKKYS